MVKRFLAGVLAVAFLSAPATYAHASAAVQHPPLTGEAKATEKVITKGAIELDIQFSEPKTNELMFFDASSHGHDIGMFTYEYDLDGDGTFEANIPQPYIQHTYFEPVADQKMSARLTDESGNQATTTITFDVVGQEETEPEFQKLPPVRNNTVTGNGVIEVSFTQVEPNSRDIHNVAFLTTATGGQAPYYYEYSPEYTNRFTQANTDGRYEYAYEESNPNQQASVRVTDSAGNETTVVKYVDVPVSESYEVKPASEAEIAGFIIIYLLIMFWPLILGIIVLTIVIVVLMKRRRRRKAIFGDSLSR